MSGKKKAVKGEVKSDSKVSLLYQFFPLGGWYTVMGGVVIGLLLGYGTYNYTVSISDPVKVVQNVVVPIPNIEVPEIILETITPADVEVIKESAPDINIPAEPDGGSYAEEPKDYDCGYFVGVWTDEVGRDAALRNCDVVVLHYMGETVYFWNVKTTFMTDVTNLYYF